MRRHAAALAVVTALLLGAPTVARAQAAADVAAARELFVQAALESREGRWREARDLYAKSLDLKRAPITLYSLGVAQSKTGRLVDALESLRAFLAEPSVPATAPYEQPARDEIAALDRRVARVKILVQPRGLAGLQVTVDGAAVPVVALEVSRLLDPGAHRIVAQAPGHTVAQAEVTVGEGEAASTPLTLVPLPVVSLPIGRVAPPVSPPFGPPAPEPRRPGRALPFALLGAGGAVFLTGLGVGLVGLRQGSGAPTRDGPEASAARVETVAGDVTAGVGVATAGAGVVLLLVQRGATPPKAAWRITPWLAGTSAGVAGSF
jgi:hypothetical protein